MNRIIRNAALISLSLLPAPVIAQQKTVPAEKPKAEITIDEIKSQASDTLSAVEQTIEKMREVKSRVGKKETGSKTQAMQKDILSSLDALIQMAEQQQQQQREQQKKQKQKQQQQQKQRSQEQPKQSQQGKQQQKEQGQQPTPDGRRKDDGQDSSTKIEERAVAAAELAKRKVVLQQVWGHLPERLRERVLNMSDDKYLPKYENLIKKYFEALAEKRKSRP